MSLFLILCLSMGILGAYGSLLVPDYEAGSLYAGYDGAYAAKYDNYQKSYAYEYGVSDPHTGDHKSQWETKDKDGTVRGSYSLLEPDGTTRIVDYVADEHGFRAVVKKVGAHGVSVESHGGAEEHVEEPQVALSHPTTTIEQPSVVYHSYDGGYEDYSDLKPVVADLYTKPLEYAHAPIIAPKPELIIDVPEHHEQVPLTSYSHETSLYPHVEGLKIALPEEYWGQQLGVGSEEKYVIPQEKYVIHQEKYEIPQEKYVLPQEKYEIPQEKYVFPQEKYEIPQEKYLIPQEKYILPQEKQILSLPLPSEYHQIPSHPKQIQEYLLSDYHQVPQQQYHAPVPAPVALYQPQEVPQQYVVSPKGGAVSYVQEHRYNTPKGKAALEVKEAWPQYSLHY